MKHTITRRDLLTSRPWPAVPAQGVATPPPAPGRATAAPRLAPRTELVNILEYEAQAARLLPPAAQALITGSDRGPFDRITLRPRMNIRTADLDLTLSLLGETHFTPILVAPIAEQGRFHAEGEVATARGTSTAKATMVLSSNSSKSLAETMAATTIPPWFQVFASDPGAAALAQRAVAAGCKVVCVTVGALPSTGAARTPARSSRIDWAAVGTLIRSIKAPVVVKGISSPALATEALSRGAQGLVVSNYGGLTELKQPPQILELAAIVDAVAGKAPVLVDGGFRRGTDIVKALAFGAAAVMIGRPVMWGLAAYGSEGVQGVVEMLQTETARYMAMSGRPNLKSVDRTLVRVHSR